MAKIDPRTGRILHDTPDLGGVLPAQVLATKDTVWLSGLDQGLVVELEPRTGTVVAKTTPAGGPLAFWSELATGPGGLWVTDQGEDLVWRINPTTNRADGSVAVDHNPLGIAARGGSVWVADFLAGTIDRIDPTALRVVSRANVGANPSDLASGPRGLWVSFGSSTS